MITVSAPGKIILYGEHAVVYGRSCIVTALNCRLTVSVSETEDGRVIVRSPNCKDRRFINSTLLIAEKELNIKHKGLNIETKCSFSGKYGLGSSAAVTVALHKALAALYKVAIDKKTLFDIAYRTVLNVQGRGSGCDVAAATFGGTHRFVTGGRIIRPIDTDGIPIIIGYSGIKGSTVELVGRIAKKFKEEPEKLNRIFKAIGKIVKEAEEALIGRDWKRVGTLMNFNQEYLRDIGVSHEKLETIISAAKKAGAYGAKLSGSGGGDCMIALHPDGISGKCAVSEAIRKAGGEVVDVSPNAEGVRIEKS